MNWLACVVLLIGSAALAQDDATVKTAPEKSRETAQNKSEKEPEIERPTRPPACERRLVDRAIDGHTLQLRDGRQVLLIGIECPPRLSKEAREKALSRKATRFTLKLVEGKPVWLEYDKRKKDKYGRSLAYVWTPSNDAALLLNAQLVTEGLAKVVRQAPNVKHHQFLQQLQAEAQEAGVGLWETPGQRLERLARDRRLKKKKAKEKNKQKDPSDTSTVDRQPGFHTAMQGDYWRIDSEHVALCHKPELFGNIEGFKRNLIIVLKLGSRVEILESKGWFSPWKRVYLVDARKKPLLQGWILAESVKKATLVEKSAFRME